MATLLLRFAAPMQSWGTSSRFTERDTRREPSKSGVVGLLCAAFGIQRDGKYDKMSTHRDSGVAFADISNLRMGVRVNDEGSVAKDFHTTLDVVKASGSSSNNAVLSNRYYLADADFLVGLETDDVELLKHIYTAIANPHWALFLGRKAFPPGKPILPSIELLGINRNPLTATLLDALQSAKLDMDKKKEDKAKKLGDLRYVIEILPSDEGYLTDTVIRIDEVESFSERSFHQRRVRIDYHPINEGVA